MTDPATPQNKGDRAARYNTPAWKLFLVYDIFMMLIIVVNLICLCANAFLISHFGAWFFDQIHLASVLSYYKSDLHPWVIKTESWFITFLVAELLLRWFIAIVNKHHQRWFFFPFIHWYEVLAVVPYLRFLRLIRAAIIAYRMSELGYQVVPEKVKNRILFYYSVVMEELSDRVVITVIDGIRQELATSSSHKKIIHNLVDHHRDLFAKTVAEILQESLATELRVQQRCIAENVGEIVKRSIEDTPQLTQLLKLIPIAGSMIEHQIQNIGQRLGENITSGLIAPLTQGSVQQPNAIYDLVSKKLSHLNIENQTLEELVESAVYESLAALRKQVKIKQWQVALDKNDQVKE